MRKNWWDKYAIEEDEEFNDDVIGKDKEAKKSDVESNSHLSHLDDDDDDHYKSSYRSSSRYRSSYSRSSGYGRGLVSYKSKKKTNKWSGSSFWYGEGGSSSSYYSYSSVKDKGDSKDVLKNVDNTIATMKSIVKDMSRMLSTYDGSLQLKIVDHKINDFVPYHVTSDDGSYVPVDPERMHKNSSGFSDLSYVQELDFYIGQVLLSGGIKKFLEQEDSSILEFMVKTQETPAQGRSVRDVGILNLMSAKAANFTKQYLKEEYPGFLNYLEYRQSLIFSEELVQMLSTELYNSGQTGSDFNKEQQAFLFTTLLAAEIHSMRSGLDLEIGSATMLNSRLGESNLSYSDLMNEARDILSEGGPKMTQNLSDFMDIHWPESKDQMNQQAQAKCNADVSNDSDGQSNLPIKGDETLSEKIVGEGEGQESELGDKVPEATTSIMSDLMKGVPIEEVMSKKYHLTVSGNIKPYFFESCEALERGLPMTGVKVDTSHYCLRYGKRLNSIHDGTLHYSEIVSTEKSLISQLEDELDFSRDKNRFVDVHGMRSGDLDEGSFHKLISGTNEDTIFSQRELFEVPNVEFSIIVDQSGSMCGEGEELARKVAVCMAEAVLANSGVELNVFGFTADHISEIRKPEFSDWDNMDDYKTSSETWKIFSSTTDPEVKKNLLGNICALGGNYDSYSIKGVGEYLKYLHPTEARRRIVLVISDGYPCESQLEGRSSLHQVGDKVNYLRDDLGFDVYGICIFGGWGDDAGETMYGKGNFVTLDYKQSSSQKLGMVLSKIVSKIIEDESKYADLN